MAAGINNIEEKIFVSVPLFMIIIDILRSFSIPGLGTLAQFALFLLHVYFIIRKKGILTFNYWLTIFVVYTLCLGLYSSDITKTFQNYISVLVSVLFLPLSYIMVRSLETLKKLNRSMVWLSILFVTFCFIFAILGIGENVYGGGLTLGAFTFAYLYSGSLYLVILPLVLPDVNRKLFRIIILITSLLLFIFLLLSMRRTAFLIPVLGYFIYFIFTKHKKILIMGFAGIVLVMLASFPLYRDILIDQIQNREHAFADDYNVAEERRVLETGIVMNERLSNTTKLKTTLFGKETFNSYGNYNNGEWGLRPLHIDFNKLLHGTGIIGLFLYIMIFVSIYITFIRIKRNLPRIDYFNEMAAVFRAFFILCLFVSTLGGFYIITFRAIMFIYMGAILGVYKNYSENPINQEIPLLKDTGP